MFELIMSLSFLCFIVFYNERNLGFQKFYVYHSAFTLPVSCAPVDEDCHCTLDLAHSPRTPWSPPHRHPSCDIVTLTNLTVSQSAVDST